MNIDINEKQTSGIIVSRQLFLRLLTFALAENSTAFLQEASTSWLEEYPGDLDVRLFSAYGIYLSGDADVAYKELFSIILKNPEQYAAWLSMTQIGTDKVLADAWGGVYALGGNVTDSINLPIWSAAVRALNQSLKEDNLEQTESFLESVLVNSGCNPLVDLSHLRYALKYQSGDASENLARLYQARWPDCIQFQIVLADQLIQHGDEFKGMEMMQQCILSDPSGEIASSIFGKDHAYLAMWPETQEIALETPIPMEIAVRLGWNQLSSSNASGLDFQIPIEQLEEDFQYFENQLASQSLANENIENGMNPGEGNGKMGSNREIKEISHLFNRIAKSLGKEEQKNLEGRYPTYVILSSKQALFDKYGPESCNVLVSQMESLVETIKQRPGWNALMFLPDDNDLMSELGLSALDTKDPWKVKLAVADLDRYLQSKGAMIGAILIVGGNDIIPYHRLPNPTDDSDHSIASDNPYASVDANYYVPEWALGRFPDESGNDPGLLLLQLRNAIKYHSASNKVYKSKNGVAAFPLEMLIQFFLKLFGINQSVMKSNNLGYSASIWRRSSIAAYRPIGSANLLAVSPPTNSKNIDELWLSEVEFSYFNLHGIEDGPEWYGQKDFIDMSNGPDYPVALSPEDIGRVPKYSQVVFTEACYGAHVEKKKIEESIALKYISSGCKALIGSTCIAYGSVQPPLIGADLLAFIFWKRVQDGYPIGEAIMRAKVEAAEEMQKRQGFLDGEDQKTLLSFVLFGDPLMIGSSEAMKNPKKIERLSTRESLIAISETDVLIQGPMRISKKTLNDVKQMLSEYLPGLDEAEIKISQQFQIAAEEVAAKFGHIGTPEKMKRTETGNIEMSFQKDITVLEKHHKYFAKVTVDELGKIIKLAVSR